MTPLTQRQTGENTAVLPERWEHGYMAGWREAELTSGQTGPLEVEPPSAV